MATIDGETARIIQAACDIEQALRNSVPRTRYVFANEKGEVLIDHAWAGDHVCGFPLRISLHQPDIEDAIDAAARASGAEINQGWEVVSLAQDERRVMVTARERRVSGDKVSLGIERTVEAKFVIGADGARSVIRTTLGIAREPWPHRNAWYTIDARRKRPLPNLWGLSPDAQIATIICAPEGRAHSIIPLGTEVVRFNFEVDPDRDHSDKLNRTTAYRYLQDVYGLTEGDVDVYRQAIYPFEGQLATHWRCGRAFLAGDAAHLMTPFQGQGGCSALRDAINISWKLDLVLRGVAGDALLDTYEAERLPHARYHIDSSDQLATLAFVHDPVAAQERDRRLRERQTSAPPGPYLTAGILHRKRDGRLVPPVGDVGPQGIVRRGNVQRRFDDLGWGFQLILRDVDPVAHLTADQREFLRNIRSSLAGITDGSDVALWTDVESVYGRYFREHRIVGVLLRPDFVVFGVVRSIGDISDLVNDLRGQLTA